MFLGVPSSTGVGGKNTLCAKSTAQIGILPFQIFSGDKVEYLNEVIADNLSQQLRTKEGVTIIKQKRLIIYPGKNQAQERFLFRN